MGSDPLRYKVLLPQLKMIFFIFMALLTCGGGQQIPPPDRNTLILINVIDALDSLSLQLKEFEEKVEAKFEETQKTIQADIKRLQQCSTEVQLSQFQELVFKDPCEDGSHTCSDMSTCTNYFNRYECSCLPGYSGDGFTCQDVDECSLNTDDCSEEKICINNPGSYECKKCPRFFKKEGDICQGPVCESPSLFIPEIGCLTLFVREDMPWDEGKLKCQEMGLRLAEGIQRRHFQALSDHFPRFIGGHYYASWIGFRHRQWVNKEEEKIQEEEWIKGQPDGDLEECGYIRLSPSYLGLGDDPCSQSRYLLCQSLP